jgi:hypothetical protein
MALDQQLILKYTCFINEQLGTMKQVGRCANKALSQSLEQCRILKGKDESGVVVHTSNPSTWKAWAGE